MEKNRKDFLEFDDIHINIMMILPEQRKLKKNILEIAIC